MEGLGIISTLYSPFQHYQNLLYWRVEWWVIKNAPKSHFNHSLRLPFVNLLSTHKFSKFMSLKAMVCPFFKNSFFFFKKISVHIISITYKLQQHNSKVVCFYFDCHWLFSVPLQCNIPLCPLDARKGVGLV